MVYRIREGSEEMPKGSDKIEDSKEAKETLQPGDPWPEHYRGTRYHYDSEGHMWWLTPKVGSRVYVKKGQSDVVKELLRLRPEGGSFRITETGHVIMRDLNSDPPGKPIYVTDYGGSLEFEHVDNSAAGLVPKDIWPSFYDGAKYSFMGDRIWWNNPETGTKQLAREHLPDPVMRVLSALKPEGGSFRVTENGRVLTLIPPQPMPVQLQAQYNKLSNAQKNLIAVKVVSTSMLPVYVGDYFEGFSLFPVRNLTDPLPVDIEREILDFLNSYGPSSSDNPGRDIILPDFTDDRQEEPE